MTPSDQSACEDCGAARESVAGWNRPSGITGYASSFTQLVQPAPHMLGHDGYLCRPCWWKRARA